MPIADPQRIADLELKRSNLRACAESLLLEKRAAGVTELTGADEIRFRAMVADVERVDGQLAELRRMGSLPANLQRAVDQAMTQTQARSAQMNTYPSNVYQGVGQSYVRDLARLALNADDTNESRRRLGEHARETRDISRVDGSGGYAVPPAWLMSQYVGLPRPGRAFANLVQRQPLPGGTDSINIPKILTGTKVGMQTTDNQPIVQIDITDTFVNAPVRTIAGQQSVALQLIDQSPIAFDEVIFADLAADHDRELDRQCLSGSGINGEVLGTLNTPGINTVAITTLDIAGYFKCLANAINEVNVTRYLPPDVIVMHPRRWAHMLTLLDDVSRPLFIPSSQGPQNAAGILSDVASENVVGRCCGLPIVIDSNVPTDGGTNADEDLIIVMRSSDLVLWESGVRMRALPETKAQTLTVVLQVYSYIAFSASRLPKSVVTITGLTPPVWT